ncbi:CELL DIVISION PROTEIN KINASE [Salix purpurea]|uniref:CELL DIVISION PROTEIN KINASE n=1 Tax=Salix purpurea TaxID=77065 RepID=A0A9Q0UR49_SALPP|nr:CELL DIVISION PROTEIN KINASE [Salix purpurea]
MGLSKLLIFGLARIYQAPLKALSDNGVVVTICYPAPKLLPGAKHYTSAIEMWAGGCIFAELLTLKPLFQGAEAKSTPNPFQLHQLDKIFMVLGHPTLEKWPTLASLPHWHNDVEHIQGHKYMNTGLHSVVPLSPKGATFDLLDARISSSKAYNSCTSSELDYFRSEPLPGRKSLSTWRESHQLSYSSSRSKYIIAVSP